MSRQDKHAQLEELAPVIADTLNALRPVYKKHKSRAARMKMKDTIAACLYYLPQFPKNSPFIDEDNRPAVNNHIYPRAKAALELLTAEDDITPSEFVKAYEMRYGVVEFISHKVNKSVKHFRASDNDLMTADEKRAAEGV